MAEYKVSAPQFFSLMFLSVLNTMFMYISSADIYIAQSDALLRPFVFILISFICVLPQYFVYKHCEKLKSKGFEIKKTSVLKFFALAYGIIYFICTLRSVSRFDLFLSSELFPGTDMTPFIIAIVVICGVLSLLGIGALCRGGTVFTFIVVAATVFVMVSLGDEISLLNFTPFFKDGGLKFLSDSMLFSLQATELGAVLIFLPFIEGNVKKHFSLWVILSGAVFVAILFFVIGSLGAFADTQLFPTYSSVTLAGFGLLKRIDALEAAVWILCVIIKISFYILVSVKSFNYVFNRISKKVLCGVLCGILSLVLVVISGNIELFGFVSRNAVTVVLYCLGVIALPLGVLIYLKRGKVYEKNF